MLDIFAQQTESTALWSLPKRNELTFILTQNIIFGAPYHGVVWRKTRLQSLNNKDIQIFRRSINSQRLSSGTKRWLPCLAPDIVNETTLPPKPVSQQQGKRVWVFWDLELTLLYPEYSEVDPKSGILKSGALSFNGRQVLRELFWYPKTLCFLELTFFLKSLMVEKARQLSF